MQTISRAAPRKDHQEKAGGYALYMADWPTAGVLTAALVRSPAANAALDGIVFPPMPAGYFAADGRDIPCNETDIHHFDMPVFPTESVRYVGEPVAIIAGPDAKIVAGLARQTRVRLSDERAAITSIDASPEDFFQYDVTKGDRAEAFAQADFIHEETFETGLQEQAYMETQALQCAVMDGVLTAEGSMQCPYYIVNALRHAFLCDAEKVRVIQRTTGGGFGGKEDTPSHLACQLMAVAMKAGKPCRIVLDRHEDMAYTTKRHPARLTYRMAVRAGRVTGMDVDVVLDAGAYSGLSGVVLQRTMFSAAGVYNIENLTIQGRAAMTNTPSNGAFRGFGGPQAFAAMETVMSHLATRLGVDAVEFKRAHLVRQGDLTTTSGRYHEPVPLPGMLAQAMEMSGYAQKRAAFAGDKGRFRRGIGLSMIFHGCGFSLNGEADLIRARIRLEKHADDTVVIHGANTEMGQGVATTFPKIVAQALDIPYESVRYAMPDTATDPDSGPTVASRSILIVGRILERAAKRMKAQWKSGEALTVEEEYIDPPHRIRFDGDAMRGDAYPAYSWGVNVVEVAVDTCTHVPRITGVWAVFDCGTPIDLNALRGQAEGGIVQGLGYGGMECMDVRADGSVRQASMTDYILPTAMDIPPIAVAFYEDPYYDGPFGARGAGEMTLVAAAPAYVAAIENAVGIQAAGIPLTPEAIGSLREEGRACP